MGFGDLTILSNGGHRRHRAVAANAIRTLPAPESECLEEHLLICSECRDRLESTDEYVAAMRSAAKIREIEEGE
jgi:predicted anti-sigma-YlaC factor YlaD